MIYVYIFYIHKYKSDSTKQNGNITKPISEIPTLKTPNAMENPLLSNNKSAVIQGNSVVIDFKSKEEAEEAFKKLLKDSVSNNVY